MTEEPNPVPGLDPDPAPKPDSSPNPILDLTQERLEAMLRRAIWNTLILGLVASLVLWKASGWRNAAMMATGASISAFSIGEWRRLVRFLNARFDKVQLDRRNLRRGGLRTAVFLVLRLTVFAAVIYGSLKCFRGSPVALLCGLGLAAMVMLWEAIRLLRD
ncbi:MAG: hypothetical protein ACP5FH_03465 [Terracidiphilus sp.]